MKTWLITILVSRISELLDEICQLDWKKYELERELRKKINKLDKLLKDI
jgi:hypothetical protein